MRNDLLEFDQIYYGPYGVVAGRNHSLAHGDD
jgi:hypothetical protein